MDFIIFILIAAIAILIIAVRLNSNGSVYKYISKNAGSIYDKVAPYSFKEIRQKVKDLGQEYTKKTICNSGHCICCRCFLSFLLIFL